MKRVICLNTKEIFENYIEAADYYEINNDVGIYRCCINIQKTCGKFKKEKLFWMYKEDYEKLTEQEKIELDKKIEKNKPKKIVCLNNEMVFDSESDAIKWVDSCNPTIKARAGQIKMCCNKKLRSAGRINYIKMKWMYLDEFKEILKKETTMFKNINVKKEVY